MSGWIKLHRSIIDSDIYQMPPLYLRVFERMVLEANHQDNEIPYREKGSKLTGKKLIRRGERLTSVRDICKWVAWYERGKLKEPNPKTVQDILDWLEENSMVQIYGDKGNRKETHYKIVNYNVYQKKEDDEVTENKQISNRKVTENKQSLETNKNVKNVKNEKNVKNNVCMYDENFKQITNIYSENIGQVLPIIGEQLKVISEEVPADLFKEAVLIAVDRNKRYINYIEGILRNWKDVKINTLSDLEIYRREKELEREENKNKQIHNKPKSGITRFHNFEQRTDKYSDDEINKKVENIAARKRREYRERLKQQEEGSF